MSNDFLPQDNAFHPASVAHLESATMKRLSAKLRDGSITGVYRLSPLQEGMLFDTLRSLDNGNYVSQSVYDTDRELDLETFIAAWRFVCNRHDTLRTTFEYEDVPEPVQVVHRSVQSQVRMHDWTALGAEEKSRSLDHLLHERRARGMDLVESPPLAFDLIKLPAGRYQMVWHLHHLLIDGASSATVLDELALTYQSLADRGEFPSLPEPVQFREHLNWLAQNDDAKEIEEWSGIVGDLAEPTSLSCISPFRDGEYHASESIVRTVDSDAVERLSAFSQRHRCTLHTLFQAAWALVLRSRSGSSDLCWGTIFSGRSADQAHLEDVVGLVINTVPARIRVDPSASVTSWLRELQTMLSTAHRNEHVGLDRIRRVTSISGDEDLFQTLFQFVPEPHNGEDGSGKLGLRLVDAREQTGYPLDMSVVMRDELIVHLAFEPSRLAPDIARQIIDQYIFLLHELVGNEHGVLADLRTQPESECDRLATWSRAATWRDSAETIPELFMSAVNEHSDRIALLSQDGELTYRELDHQSDQIASTLREAGVGPETVVGVAMPRSNELITVLIGILKAGGAYLIVDLDAPEDHLRYILRDSNPSLVVAAGIVDDRLDLIRAQCEVRSITSLLNADGSENPPIVLSPDSLAFVTYTSGSTGVPKCVGMTHRNLIRIGYRPDYFASDPSRRFLQLAQVSFDASVEEIWGSLLNGASLVMPGKSQMDIPDIADLIHRFTVTTVSMTTGLFHQFVDQDAASLRSVEELIVGGEAVRRPQCDRLLSVHPELSLINTYGPTETTTTATSAIIDYDPYSEVPIGRPVTNTTVYVLDDDLKMVPVGVNGQLYLGGTGVTRGYLNDSGLTAQKFLPNPFSATPGARMYATGDIVRWLPDEQLEFVGRADRQVKVRGFRVEPGEVEATLAEHDYVQDVVVEPSEDETGLKQLVAYVVPVPESGLSKKDLRDFTVDRLPRYMVPAHIALLDQIPLTAIGKVDRARLPAEPEPLRASGTARPAHTETEKTLSAIWARFLAIDEPSIDDNFFDLGGDSILSMRVASAARQVGIALSSTDLFKQQTIAELAAVLDVRDKPEPADQRPVIGDVKLTPIQRWFLEHHSTENHFNQSRLLRWKDSVSAPALERALTALTDHHDVLRLRVTSDGERWRQWFAAPDERVCLDEHDLRKVPDDELDDALDRVGEAVQGSMDLRSGPVMRAALIRTAGDAGDMLFVAIHHLAVDLVSWNILLEDLTSAYQAAVRGEPVALPAKTTSFKAWSDHMHDAITTQEFARHREYWRDLDVDVRPLPIEETGSDTATGISSIRFSLSSDETQRFLRAIRGKNKVTGPELLIGATIPAFRDWIRDGSIVIDLEIHGRETNFNNLDVTRTVGWFTTCYPIKLDVSMVDTLGGYVHQVRDQVLTDPGRALSYGIAKYLVAPEAGRSAFPNAEVCFNYLGELRSGHSNDDLFAEETWILGAEGNKGSDPAYPLDITGGVADGHLFIDIAFAKRRWQLETVQAFADSFRSQLHRSIAQLATWEMDQSHPSSWIARLGSVSPLLTAPMKQYHVPGVSVATISAGQVSTWAHGGAGRGEAGVDVDTQFPVGSVAKHLAAITVMRLCERGVIDLDQPFNDLSLPMRMPTFPGAVPLTVRHLLAHRTGLAFAEGESGVVTAVRPAGTDYEYALGNYSIVEQMLEELTGMSFGEALATHIFEPLGLKNSELLPLYPDPEHHPRTAVGHSATGRQYTRPRRAPKVPVGPELWMTAGDIVRVGADLYQAMNGDDGVLLRKDSVVEMMAGLRSGYGLGTVMKELNSRQWVGHPGDGPGFRTIYAIDIRDGYGLVVLANGDGATPMFEDLLVELGTDLVMRVQGTLMTWEKG